MKIQLFKPIGSTFLMLCDIETGEMKNAVAPSALAFLSAGIGFFYDSNWTLCHNCQAEVAWILDCT